MMQTTIGLKLSFVDTLYKRADEYFDANRFGKYANGMFAAKAVLLLALYAGAYIYFIFFFTATSWYPSTTSPSLMSL